MIVLGYERAQILDAMLTLSEQGKETNKIPSLIIALEDKKKKVDAEKANENSKDEVKTEDSDNNCKICFELRIDVVLIPCGHVVVCESCSKSLDKCPVCRKGVNGVVKMFKA